MLYYIYDGSFEGLLTAIYDAYYRPEKPDYITTQGEYQPDLFSREITIATNLEKCEKVYRSIEEKISFETLTNVFYAYISDFPGVGTLIFNYLQLGWKVGPTVNSYLAENTVRSIIQICHKVTAERHRMLGLLRFRKLHGDIYYAAMEPDHNITGILAPHFAKRLADQNWMIHDLKRGIAAIYNQKEWIIAHGDINLDLIGNEEEALYQQLWKEYYASISIENRKNSRLQRQYMPLRYWKHLTEKQ